MTSKLLLAILKLISTLRKLLLGFDSGLHDMCLLYLFEYFTLKEMCFLLLYIFIFLSCNCPKHWTPVESYIIAATKSYLR